MISARTLTYVLGVSLAAVGLMVQPATLLMALRGSVDTSETARQLLLGARLFKINLVILGILAIVLAWTSISWRRDDDDVPRSDSFCMYFCMTFILVIAVLLRLYGLNHGLWYDEIISHLNYGNKSIGDLITTYDSENLHPMFAILSNMSVKTFGTSNWSIRLPAVLFGAGSIMALFLFVRQVGNRREALLSSAIVTCSYHHIWFSQNARGYTGLLFWTLLSSWLFLRALWGTKPKLWLLYAIVSSLGVYTHMTMVFIVVSQLLVYIAVLIARRRDFWNDGRDGLILGFLLAGFFSFVLYALVFPQVLSTIGEPSNVAAWKNPLWTGLELVRGMRVGFAGVVAALSALALAMVGMISIARSDPVVIGLTFVPAIVGTSIIVWMGHPLWPRFFFFLMGFWTFIVIRGTTVIGAIIARWFPFNSLCASTMGTILGLCIVVVAAVSAPAAYGPKQDYLGALSYVQENRREGDSVVTVGLTTVPYQLFYQVDWKSAKSREELNHIRSAEKRTWLLYTMPLHLQGEHFDMMTVIKREFILMEKFGGTLNGGTIFVCLAQ